ncbi:MAG: hypothetical protein PGN07_08245 [Aeromicrobium erythreum]
MAAAELPLVVAPGAAPTDLVRGDRVDVWTGPGPGDDTGLPARRVLGGVPVVSVGRGSGGGRTVVVDVGRRPLAPAVVAAVGAGHVTLVRVP